MILLTAAGRILQIVSGQAVTVDVHASWAEEVIATGVVSLGSTNTAITTATTTPVVAEPTSGSVRKVKALFARNRHATDPVDLTVQHTDGSTVATLVKVTLATGETLQYVEGDGFRVWTALGAIKQTTALTVATQAQQEAATEATAVVVPSMQHFHPSAAKCWAKLGLTGNVLLGYNVPSSADTGTGAVTITIGTDFSGTAWSCVAMIELTSTTVAQSCTYDSMAAGTVILRSVVESGSAADPVTWSFAGFGDQ